MTSDDDDVYLTDELAHLEGKARDNIKRLYNVG